MRQSTLNDLVLCLGDTYNVKRGKSHEQFIIISYIVFFYAQCIVINIYIFNNILYYVQYICSKYIYIYVCVWVGVSVCIGLFLCSDVKQ